MAVHVRFKSLYISLWPSAQHQLEGPVHTNPFANENGAVLLRFQKDLRPHLSFSYRFRPSTLQHRICLKTLLYPHAHGQMNSTHAHFNISAREIGAKLKLHGSACPPFWVLTVEWF